MIDYDHECAPPELGGHTIDVKGLGRVYPVATIRENDEVRHIITNRHCYILVIQDEPGREWVTTERWSKCDVEVLRKLPLHPRDALLNRRPDFIVEYAEKLKEAKRV